MRNLSKSVKSSLKYDLFTDITRIQAENHICESYSVYPMDIDDNSSWIEFHSVKSHRLAVLMHRKYRLAFVLTELEIRSPDFHVEYVDSFDEPEWYIDDVDVFNNDFPYLRWHEPETIVNPHGFDLMDMRFATE